MDTAPNNPPTNTLPDGVAEEAVMEVVAASGYPLQTLVASDLRRDFYHVQEEWSYPDRDTGELRTLDVWAVKYLSGPTPPPGKEGHLDIGLALLIECKQP